jgi:putative transposase
MTLVLFYDMFAKMPLGWEIMPTENTQAIAVAMRRAILMLGKTPRAVYIDNGKAFRARFFRGTGDFRQCGLDGLFKRLEMEPVYAWKYHGQSKTVERFFGVLGEFERKLPSYVGRNPADKPARMRMNETWHRKMHRKLTGGRAPELLQVHQALAMFFEEYSRREQRSGHLRGLRPYDVFTAGRGPGVDPEGLRELMMHVTLKRPGRNGIKVPGLGRKVMGEWPDYYHPSLSGRRHPVLVRYDAMESDYVLVYETSGEFICRAEPWGTAHPLASITGDEADRAGLRDKIGVKRGVIRESLGVVRAICNDLVIPETRQLLECHGLSHEVAPANTASRQPKVVKITDHQAARLERESGQVEVMYLDTPGAETPPEAEVEDLSWRELDRLPELERYERLLELEVRGVSIPARLQTFMAYFEKGPVYAGNREWLEARRMQMAAFSQAAAQGGLSGGD